MNCPKCGCEVGDNQKFCGSCGAKLEHIEDVTSEENVSQDLASEDRVLEDTYNKVEKPVIEDKTAKIIIAISCLVLIIGAVFGIIQYKQYQKDIEPVETKINFDKAGNVLLKANYDADSHKAILKVVFTDNKIEDWQVQYHKEYYNNVNSKFTLKKDKDATPFDIEYSNIHIEKDKSPEMEYYIPNINSKKFVNIKEVIVDDKHILSLEVPFFIYGDKKTREAEKKKYITWKKEKEAKEEAERKQREWQEKILSNCVYKTSDGVCFTTHVFEAEPVEIESNEKWNEKKNYWLGAKDFCESKGYKLPSDDELRSLFQDILGIEIKAGINIKSYKYRGTTEIPTNYDVLKRIAPNGFSSYDSGTSKWNSIWLWEDESFDDKTAYIRIKDIYWGDDETYQATEDKYRSGHDAICVYNPNGKPHKSLVQKQKEAKERAEKEAKRKEQQAKQDVEDALF